MPQPNVVAAAPPQDDRTSWVPTRTWIAAQITLLGGILVNALATDWSVTETKAVALWALAAIVSYLVPDKKTSP